jgi:hypothetical protein
MKTDWPIAYYYIIVGMLGGMLGILGSERPRIGVIAGTVAGVGLLAIVATFIHFFPKLPKGAMVAGTPILVGIGLLPGIITYAVLERVDSRPHDREFREELAKARRRIANEKKKR